MFASGLTLAKTHSFRICIWPSTIMPPSHKDCRLRNRSPPGKSYKVQRLVLDPGHLLGSLQLQECLARWLPAASGRRPFAMIRVRIMEALVARNPDWQSHLLRCHLRMHTESGRVSRCRVQARIRRTSLVLVCSILKFFPVMMWINSLVSMCRISMKLGSKARI